MSVSHKPDNYSTVSPYLVVAGASATIDFLVKVLDAVELRRFPGAAGKVLHAEVRIDDTVVMIADGGEGWPPVPSHVHVYVRDVDATYKRALDAGATSVQEPVKKEDEDKRGAVKDAGGTTWWIATMMKLGLQVAHVREAVERRRRIFAAVPSHVAGSAPCRPDFRSQPR